MTDWAKERTTRAMILIAFAATFITGLVLIPNLGFTTVSHQVPATSPSVHPTAHPSSTKKKRGATKKKRVTKPSASPTR